MAKVHFVKELSKKACQLIEARGSIGKIKAYSDVQQILFFLSAYENGRRYDTASAKELDERLRKEYPVIDSIDALPAPSRIIRSNIESSPVDADIERLLQDYWGVQADVLFKDGIINKLGDFIDRVE
ncbi:MAG: hypothetical protein Q4C25_06575 [Bacillota bacterium]|nr:hypothetical protein [Bacillota bacterium]